MKTVFLSHQVHKRKLSATTQIRKHFFKAMSQSSNSISWEVTQGSGHGTGLMRDRAHLGFCLLSGEDKVPEPRQRSWARGAEQEDLWNHTSCVWREGEVHSSCSANIYFFFSKPSRPLFCLLWNTLSSTWILLAAKGLFLPFWLEM